MRVTSVQFVRHVASEPMLLPLYLHRSLCTIGGTIGRTSSQPGSGWLTQGAELWVFPDQRQHLTSSSVRRVFTLSKSTDALTWIEATACERPPATGQAHAETMPVDRSSAVGSDGAETAATLRTRASDSGNRQRPTHFLAEDSQSNLQRLCRTKPHCRAPLRRRDADVKFETIILVAVLVGTSCGSGTELPQRNSDPDDRVRQVPNTVSTSEAPVTQALTPTTIFAPPSTVAPVTEQSASELEGADESEPPQSVSTRNVSGSLQPRRWLSRPLEPQIAVTFVDEGWTASDFGCGGLLDYATFRHYPDFATTAAFYVGPIHQDCSFVELVADLPTIDSAPVQVEIGVDEWYALRYEESQPDWSYLGVRLGPNTHGLGHLYLIEGEERNYFAFITAPADLFEEFAAMARTVLASLELDVDP